MKMPLFNKKKFHAALLALVSLTLVSCDKNSSSFSASSSSNWERTFTKDAFNDKSTLRFLANASEGQGYLLLLCEEGTLKFFWQYGSSGRAPFGGMDMDIMVRIDDMPTFEEEWGWGATQPLMFPKGEKTVFLDKLVGKKRLALKSVLAQSTYAVFNISGFDQAYREVKKACNK